MGRAHVHGDRARTVAVIRLPMSDLAPGERELDDAQARYVSRVHRLRAGTRLVAFDPKRALECEAVIVSPRRIRLGEPHPAKTMTSRLITWIHGCPKGDKADAIVRDATELGATRIVFVPTERSVARPLATRVLRWSRIADQAARQCGRGDAPTVELATDFGDALESVSGDARICLDPRGAPLREVLGAAGSLVFAAGPEGGFTESELGVARAHAFEVRSLGTLVLRTETVPAAALGAAALFG
jgi:16S rRNA (uracil1498-N3)-methyltransferase